MRRTVIGALLLAVTFTLAGCVQPDGTDGNLTNGWPLPPDPKLPAPSDGACYQIQTEDPADVAKWPEPVNCDTQHTVETVHLGQYTGADAERSTPPSIGGAEQRKAFEECAAKSKGFLGADWRTGRLGLFLVLPSELHWGAGARWFRCDLVEYKDLEGFAVVSRATSLKGALSATGAVRLLCAEVTNNGNTIDKVLPVPCETAHDGEFAGIYEHPDGPYPLDKAALSKANLDGCRGVVAAYTGVPNDAEIRTRVGQVASPFTKAAWELGNRGVRCYLWSRKPVTGSLKGAGPSALPTS